MKKRKIVVIMVKAPPTQVRFPSRQRNSRLVTSSRWLWLWDNRAAGGLASDDGCVSPAAPAGFVFRFLREELQKRGSSRRGACSKFSSRPPGSISLCSQIPMGTSVSISSFSVRLLLMPSSFTSSYKMNGSCSFPPLNQPRCCQGSTKGNQEEGRKF